MRYTDMLVESAESELRDILKANYAGMEVGQCYFQVYGAPGEVTVGWDLTFRRNTSTGAFKQYQQDINEANARLQRLADKYKSILKNLSLCTLQDAKQNDEWRESDGERAYSEYEQSLGGSVTFKPVAAIAPEAPKAEKPKAAPKAKAEKPVQTPVEPQAPAKAANEKSVTVRAVNGVLKDTPYRLKTGDATNSKVMVFTAGKYTGKLEAKMFGAWLKDKAVDSALIAQVNKAIAAIK